MSDEQLPDDPKPATTPAGSPTATQGGPLAGTPATDEDASGIEPEEDGSPSASEDDGGDERAG